MTPGLSEAMRRKRTSQPLNYCIWLNKAIASGLKNATTLAAL